MKSPLVFSILSLVFVQLAQADARLGDNPTSGQGSVSISGERGTVNVHIDGQAAKVLFDNMTQAKESSRRIGSLFLTDRESEQLLCSFSAEIATTYSCAFHFGAEGKVLADNVRFPRNARIDLEPALPASRIPVFAGGERGTINVHFAGTAGIAVFDRLTEVKQTTHRIGSLLLTDRESTDLRATRSAEVAVTTEVTFHVETTGKVVADNVVWTM